MTSTKKLLLGAHMSAAGGLYEAINRGQSIGCTAIQFFSKSNRQWRAKALISSDINQFKQALAVSHIEITAIHASYLINIGSSCEIIRNKSYQALQEEYARANILGVDYLVIHPGSHRGAGEDTCLNHITQQINQLLANQPKGGTQLLLETMAGQGTNVCYRFEHLATICDQIERQDLIGICFDTCHVFAAGYDLKKDYNGVMQAFEDSVGLERLKLIHLNDSKKELGSRRDRHEHIAQGLLGGETFRSLMNDPRLKHVAKVLETPKESLKEDIMNLETIKKLIQS